MEKIPEIYPFVTDLQQWVVQNQTEIVQIVDKASQTSIGSCFTEELDPISDSLANIQTKKACSCILATFSG